MQIRKAKRSAAKWRGLLTSPSGGGKTYGALLLAKGIGGRTVVIDTEQGSSDLYDSLHEFDVIDLQPPFTPEAYIAAINAAEQAGYEIIIVDSITHEWNGKGGCLELVDDIARAKFKGNTWSAYSEITPRHRAFIDAMLRSPAHIIATARSKTETAQVEEGGRKKVVKLGMAAETRTGAEYEFTTVLDLVHDGHYATASKDRTGLFSGDPKPISIDTGRRIAAWLASAQPAPISSGGSVPSCGPVPAAASRVAQPAPGGETPAEPLFDQVARFIKEAKNVRTLGRIGDRIDVLVSDDQLTADEWSALTDMVKARHDQLEPQEVANG
ncbi:MAG: AAA family ATPase [Planctomycetes bacterium]|nr:AAA family ATPase [Planctomycetota bacterium]